MLIMVILSFTRSMGFRTFGVYYDNMLPPYLFASGDLSMYNFANLSELCFYTSPGEFQLSQFEIHVSS